MSLYRVTDSLSFLNTKTTELTGCVTSSLLGEQTVSVFLLAFCFKQKQFSIGKVPPLNLCISLPVYHCNNYYFRKG